MADKNSKADTQPQEQQDKGLALSNPGEPSPRKAASGKPQPIGFSGKLTRIDN